MTSFLCEIFFSCALTAAGAATVDELTYRNVLYAYYQEDYDRALVGVMVAERQGRVGEDPRRFALAKGSFAFQEGLYRWSAAVLDAVPAAELSALDRMRLAFHRARLHYRHGDWTALTAELEHIDLGRRRRGGARRHPEVELMRAEAALARGDFAAAEAALAALDPRSAERAYGLFNLGVAQRATGDPAAARATFARLASLEPRDRDARDVVQRGRLALAMLAGGGDLPVDARQVLASLPADGRYRDLALGRYAELARDGGDHELAARIWLTVLEQPDWGPGHAAAHLGLPMSLEELGSPARALERYRAAERVFERRLAALEHATARAGEPAAIDDLLDQQGGGRAPGAAAAPWREAFGSAAWIEWLADDEVHRLLEEWRELVAMAGWLADLPPRLGAFEEVTRERRRRAAEANRMLDQAALPRRRAGLATRVQALDTTLAALRKDPPRPSPEWMRLLATPRERATIDELAAMTVLAARAPIRERDALSARIERLQGLTFWQIADDRAARIRELTSALDRNRALLAEVDARIARLAAAEARFAAGVETDFAALAARADAVAARVNGALDERRARVAAALRRGLEQEMARTRRHLLAARLAVARTVDRLATARPEGLGGDS